MYETKKIKSWRELSRLTLILEQHSKHNTRFPRRSFFLFCSYIPDLELKKLEVQRYQKVQAQKA